MGVAVRLLCSGLAALAIVGAAAAQTPSAPLPAPASGAQQERPALTASDAAQLALAARQFRDDGAAAPDLDGAAASLAGPAGADPAAADVARSVLQAGADLLARAAIGRIAEPSSVNREWALRRGRDPVADLAAARAGGTVGQWAQGLRPTHPGFTTLAEAHRRYAAIVAAGGWAPLAPGPVLALDADDPSVAALRERLTAEGYAVPATEKPSLFDAPLAAVIADFQARHALKVTSKLDAATRTELDVGAAERLAAIDLNLERERWLPPQLPGDRIEIDIAGQVARVFVDGTPQLDMRVIVGTPNRRTPSFASVVTGVVIHPPWVVPASIAAGELYPKERRSPGYLARNGYHAVDGQLVQAPGPRTALGYLKFEMDSPFGVYLHDTPSRALFARDRRALSHGCMRLQLPRQLAALLLAHQGWSLGDIDAAIAAGPPTRRVKLAQPMPVFVVYRTVVADAAGVISVRPDIYGWDARLAGALAGQDAALAAPR